MRETNALERKLTACDRIKLLGGREKNSLDEGSSYKYLGTPEDDRVMYEDWQGVLPTFEKTVDVKA